MADDKTAVAAQSSAADPAAAEQHPSDPRARDLFNRSKQGFRRLIHFRNVVGFLWLGPALAILILNFKNHIVGSGLNCRGHCRIDPYSTSQVQQIDRLDGTNRDVLGALQFVAKGLEVWFMYVAASLVYRAALHLSAKDNRLPVSLLLVYAEFMDLLYLKDLAIKARDLAMKKNSESPTPVRTDKVATPPILYFFLFIVAALSVIANLMGVATATLVIPGLQYIDINRDESLAFGAMLSSDPPADDSLFLCQDGQMAAGGYACTSNLYGASLDEIVEAAVATERQQEGRDAVILPPVSQEDLLSLSPNVSDSLLRAFSVDLTNYYNATLSNIDSTDRYPDSGRFNQSLRAQLQRIGPTIGLAGGCWLYDEPTIFNVSEDREVRCYSGFTEQNALKCIRWGSGWGDNSASASFTILDSSSRLTDMFVTIYTTPQARYLFDQQCIDDDSCNWDDIFTQPAQTDLRSISFSQQTYEYSMPRYSNDSAIWCDNTAFLSFATYALDPSPVSNLLQLVELGLLHDSPGLDDTDNARDAILSLHPDWTLAAWSANATDGFVPSTRGSSARFIDAFQRFTSPENPELLRFNLIHTYAALQAVSMIPYTTTTLSTSADRRARRRLEEERPYTEATLTSWATVQLWKYGIDSRTKRLGAVILIIGVVVVLATTILWFEPPKSPTHIIVTALMHRPPEGALQDVESGAPVTARFKYPILKEEETQSTGAGVSCAWRKEEIKPSD
ncbi:uncharacterized protein BDV17DRAFT_279926 [Aspergillus undulatus]|uniref:uncharacterized protein n=1 Tax=Aspergillus undulatus TaxID=1810928 RepID=UPI003CCE13A7